jgi:hypothetical protein
VVDRAQLRNGMQVVGSDGNFVGHVKSIAQFHISIDRPARMDAYAPFDVIREITQDRAVLNVPADQVDNMGWSKIPAPGA